MKRFIETGRAVLSIGALFSRSRTSPFPDNAGRAEDCRSGLSPTTRARLSRGTVTLAGLALGALIGLILAPILPPIPKAEAATSTAGSTAGAFDVSDSGAATYTIPIQVPPGVRGIQPNLALVYNSQNKENGLLGLGWSLAGFSIIHRCGATIAVDGFKGGVNYDANDKYCLDGERLILASDGYYHTEHETWQRVSYAGSATNPDYFVVQSPDGGTRIYGGSGDSRIEAQGRAQGSGIARLWALNRVQDKRANALNVTYTEDNSNGDYRPLEISYVGGTVKVTFGYENRTDIMPGYEGGALARVVYRLSTVTTMADGATAKQYRLGYDNDAQVGKSRLKTVTECEYVGTDAACLGTTNLTWTTPGGVFNNKTYAGHGISTSGVHFADLNGDGKTDYATSKSDGTHFVGLSSGNGYSNVTWSGHGLGNVREYLDMNGDGRSDYLAMSNTNYYLSMSTGGGFTNTSTTGAYSSSRAYGDFNGDGRQDIAGTYNNTDTSFWVGYGNGVSFPATNRRWPGCLVGSVPDLDCNGDAEYPGTLNTHDMNGDGKSEITFADTFVFDFWTLRPGLSTHLHLGYKTFPRNAGDLNGDGKDDLLLIPSAGGGTGAPQVYLSTGTAYVAIPWSGPTTDLDFADMNGDGMNEIVSVSGTGISRYSYAPWQPSGFYLLTDTGYAKSDSGHALADMNGDGCSDAVTLSESGTHYWSLSNCAHDLMTSVTNGQGAKVEVTYKPLTDSSVYSKCNGTNCAIASYPVKDVQDATYVVASHQQSNGIGGVTTWNYKYTGLKYDHEAARSLGFYELKVTGPDNIEQRTYLYQTRELAGQAGSTFSYVSGVERKRETFARDFVHPISGNTKIVLPRLTQTYSTGSDLNNASFGSTTTTYSNFDGFHFPGTVVTSTSDGHITTTNGIYFHDTANWILGLPISTSVTTTWEGVNSLPRTMNYSYGSGGASCVTGHTSPLPGELTSETVQQGGTADLVLTTSYGYDVNGNRCATNVTGWDGTATVTRTTKSAFGWSGRFVGWTQNTLGHTAYVDGYNTKIGAPTLARDVNGLQTYVAYDGFGRKLREDKYATTNVVVPFYLSNTTFAYAAWNSAGGQGVSTATTTAGAGTVYVFHDLLGRPVRTQSQGLWGETVLRDVAYDPLGRKSQESLPYYPSQPIYWITYGYDDLSRPLSVARPLDAQSQPCASTTDYNGLTVTGTNCKDQYVTTTKNVVGWVKNSQDNGGTVANTYDPFGNLISVRDPAGNTSSMGYDLRGRKTSMNDPDMGAWTYAYNAFGELIRQQDAKGQVTSMTYDVLGRMKTRTRTEGTTTWSYDTGAKGIGKLSAVSGPGYSETHTYDGLRGLPVARTQTINGASYSTYTSYDAYARPATLTYPTGFSTKYIYDNVGHLYRVQSNSLPTQVTYWQANFADASGAITGETFGNNLNNVYDYDPGTGRVRTMVTAYLLTTHRNLSFKWDPIGNLTERSWWDGTATRTESFDYDEDGFNLNRLTKVTGPASKSYRYDALGNFQNKSDVGNYSYTGCGNRPHAVCATSGGPVTTSFTYDANGNMLTGNGHTQTWTSFNKAKTVTKGSTTSTFAYGADDMRVSKVTGTSTTHYLGKLYEKTTSGSTQNNRHYIHAGANLVAVYNTGTAAAFTNYYHQDHLGSVDAISNEAGSITARLSYDAWGKRRNPNGTDTTTPTTSTRGFTKHEHDDEVGLINMNAREYDPVIGRFISADPVLDSGVPSQALNRYAYAGNNPLSAIDPTGHGWKKWKKKLRKIFKAVVAVVASVVTAGAAALAFGAMMAGALGGALVGASAGLVSAVQAGVFVASGALGGALGGGVGGWAQTGNSEGFRAGASAGAIGGAFGLSHSAYGALGESVAKNGALYGSAKFGAHHVLNQEIREDVNAFAGKHGWSTAQFNGALFGVSALGNGIFGSRLKDEGWDSSRTGIRGWGARSPLALPFDVADTALAYQGLPNATTAGYILSGSFANRFSGHSLGSVDAVNLEAVGLARGVTAFALPFGNIASGANVKLGHHDFVTGTERYLPNFGRIFNPDAEIIEGNHACRGYDGCGV